MNDEIITNEIMLESERISDLMHKKIELMMKERPSLSYQDCFNTLVIIHLATLTCKNK